MRDGPPAREFVRLVRIASAAVLDMSHVAARVHVLIT